MKKEPVYVLAVVSQMNRGGLESRLMDIIRNIDFDRVQLDVFTYNLEEGLLDEEARSFGCKIYYNQTLNLKNMFWYVGYFKNFLEEHPQYQIVHAHQDAWCSVFCKGAYLAKVPTRIAHSRTAIDMITVKNIVKNIIKLPVNKYATHRFAVSKKAAKWLFGERMFLEEKVQIWSNAIDCQKYRYEPTKRKRLRKELGVEDKRIIMHVGNFTAPKNHAFIIDVFNEISNMYSDVLLYLVGADSKDNYMSLIKKKVEQYGLTSKVCFLGMRTDVEALLQAADVFLFPSIFEGLPGAVVEAQASGLPCVISTNIAEEVCILDTTVQIGLDEPIERWREAVENAFKTVRQDTYEEMVCSGYDIHSLVEQLTKFYEERGMQNELV